MSHSGLPESGVTGAWWTTPLPTAPAPKPSLKSPTSPSTPKPPKSVSFAPAHKASMHYIPEGEGTWEHGAPRSASPTKWEVTNMDDLAQVSLSEAEAAEWAALDEAVRSRGEADMAAFKAARKDAAEIKPRAKEYALAEYVGSEIKLRASEYVGDEGKSPEADGTMLAEAEEEFDEYEIEGDEAEGWKRRRFRKAVKGFGMKLKRKVSGHFVKWGGEAADGEQV